MPNPNPKVKIKAGQTIAAKPGLPGLYLRLGKERSNAIREKVEKRLGRPPTDTEAISEVGVAIDLHIGRGTNKGIIPISNFEQGLFKRFIWSYLRDWYREDGIVVSYMDYPDYHQWPVCVTRSGREHSKLDGNEELGIYALVEVREGLHGKPSLFWEIPVQPGITESQIGFDKYGPDEEQIDWAEAHTVADIRIKYPELKPIGYFV